MFERVLFGLTMRPYMHNCCTQLCQTMILTFMMLQLCSAGRMLQQGAPCGESLNKQDINGGNLPNCLQNAPSKAACVELCLQTANCNAISWLPKSTDGDCYLKNVAGEAELLDRPGTSSYLACPDSQQATPPAAPASAVQPTAVQSTPGPFAPWPPKTAPKPAVAPQAVPSPSPSVPVQPQTPSAQKPSPSEVMRPMAATPTPVTTQQSDPAPPIAMPPPSTNSMPAGASCGQLVEDNDLFGGNLEALPQDTATAEQCLQICLDTAGCNGFSYLGENCYIKKVEADVEFTDRPGTTAYRVCPDDVKPAAAAAPATPPAIPTVTLPPASTPTPTPATPANGVSCGQFIEDTDLFGGNLEALPHDTETAEQCLDLCLDTGGCNGFSWLGGNCYLKRVGADAEFTGRPGTTAYRVCPAQVKPAAAPAPPPAPTPAVPATQPTPTPAVPATQPTLTATPPTPTPHTSPPTTGPIPAGSSCGQLFEDKDLFGGNLEALPADTATAEECLQICLETGGCNGFSWLSGNCYLKSVGADAEFTDRAGTTAYRVCPAQVKRDPPAAPPPPPPPPPPSPSPPPPAPTPAVQAAPAATASPTTASPINGESCGQFFEDKDLFGGNLEALPADRETAEQCLEICLDTAGCNGFSWLGGSCYIKRVGADAEFTDRAGTTAYRVCPEQVKPAAPTPPAPPPPATTPAAQASPAATPPPTTASPTNGASCGQSAEGKDLFGGNLEALPQDTATADQCLQICLDTAGCNGFSWLGGNCYLKSVGAAVEFTDRPGTTAYRVCPEDVKPAPASTPPAATPSTASATPPPSGQGSDAATPTPTTPAQTAGSGCGQFVFDKDLFGGNLEALPTDTTEEGCLQLCLDTAGCNGFSWLGMNCYIKNVGADVEFTDRPGITAYRVCPDNVKPAAPGAATPAATPPTAQPSSAATPPPATPASSSGSSCGQFAEDKDLFGGNLETVPQDTATAEQCLQICLDTAGCNGFSWLGGNCYLKTVGPDVEFTNRPGTTAYRVCPDDVKPGGTGAAAAAPTTPTAPASPGSIPPSPASATSTGASCGQFVKDKDLFGGNLEALPADTTEDGCLQLCLETASCNGFSWLGGNCYIKDVGADVELTNRPGTTAYRVCPDDVKPGGPAASTAAAASGSTAPSGGSIAPSAGSTTSSNGSGCGEFVNDKDLFGGNLEALPADTTEEGCLQLCLDTAGCNGFSWLGGNCYIKDVGADVAFTDRPGTTAYRVCPGDVKPGGTGAATVPLTGASTPSSGTTVSSSGSGCGHFVEDKDLFGGNLEALPADTATAEECLQICLDTAGCNGFSWLGGSCYIKNVGADAALTDRPGTTAYRVCPDDVKPGGPAAATSTGGLTPSSGTTTSSNGSGCGQLVEGKDLFGGNMEALPADTATVEQCLQLCLETAGCNGFSWLGANCYVKSVDADVEFTNRPGTTAYRVCPDDVKPGGPTASTSGTSAPANATAVSRDGKGCGQFVDGKDLFGGNLPGSLQEDTTEQQCLQLCLQTGGCNGFSWLGSGASGNCYLKNVAADAAFTDRPGSTAYLLCSDQGLSSGFALQSCGEFLEDQDVEGGDLPNSLRDAATEELCMSLCLEVTNCNAITWLPSASGGDCYLKNIASDADLIARPGATTFRLCPDDTKTLAPTSGTGQLSDASCGSYVKDKDLFGGDLPNSLNEDVTEDQCIELCQQTANCNAVTWLPAGGAGHCYLKNAGPEIEFTDRPGVSSYRFCGAATQAISPSAAAGPLSRPSCGRYLADKDLFGGNLEALPREDTTEEECLDLCLQTTDCNAVTWLPAGSSGQCFLKNVTPDIELTDRPGSKSYRLCTDDAQGLLPAAGPVGLSGASCGQLMKDKDLFGGNLEALPQDTATAEECLQICLDTADCNGFSWLGGSCYIKDVGPSVEVTDRPGTTSYRVCTDELVGLQPASAPGQGDQLCGSFMQDTDLFGGDLPNSLNEGLTEEECVALCLETANCNAITWLPAGGSGHCYVKDVGPSVEMTGRAGAVSYRVCTDELLGSLQPAVAPDAALGVLCGAFMEDQDLFGGNLPNSFRNQTTKENCLDMCLQTANCNAITWLPVGVSGHCYLKEADLDTELRDRAGAATYLLCADERTARFIEETLQPAAAPYDGPGVLCGAFVEDEDLQGGNLETIPGTTATADDCLHVCLETLACNAMSWLPRGSAGGDCYLKNVGLNTTYVDSIGAASFMQCSDDDLTGAGPEQPRSAALEGAHGDVRTSDGGSSTRTIVIASVASAAGAFIGTAIVVALVIAYYKKRTAASGGAYALQNTTVDPTDSMVPN